MIAVAASAAWTGQPSDEQLAQQITQRDRLACISYSPGIGARVRFIRRLVRDEWTAEDLASDVFLEVWYRAAVGYEGARAKVVTRLLSIARFKAISTLRRRREVALDTEAAKNIVELAADPEVALQDTERTKVLRECLAELSPEHGQIIELVYYQEKSVKEVAGEDAHALCGRASGCTGAAARAGARQLDGEALADRNSTSDRVAALNLQLLTLRRPAGIRPSEELAIIWCVHSPDEFFIQLKRKRKP